MSLATEPSYVKVDFTTTFEDGSPEANEQLLYIARFVPGFQELPAEDFTFTQLTGGLTNKQYKIDVKGHNTVLVRVYGVGTEVIIDRQREIAILEALSKAENISAKLYVEFTNGMIYHFIPGIFVTHELYQDPEVHPLVPLEIAKWHTTPVDIYSPPPTQKLTESTTLFSDSYASPYEEKDPYLWINLEDWYCLAKRLPSKSGYIPNWDEICEHAHRLRTATEKMPLTSSVVMCHNDLLLANLIYHKESHSLSFIDYEYAAHNPRGFDIANHFAELGSSSDQLSMNTKFPTREFRKNFLRSYFTALNSFSDESSRTEITDELIERVDKEIDFWICLAHIRWSLWSLIQEHHSVIKFDYAKFTKVRMDAYLEVYATLCWDIVA